MQTVNLFTERVENGVYIGEMKEYSINQFNKMLKSAKKKALKENKAIKKPKK